MEIRGIQMLISILEAGQTESTVLVRPLAKGASSAASQSRHVTGSATSRSAPGPSRERGTWVAWLTVTPGQPLRCQIYAASGAPAFAGSEALDFLASVGRLDWQIAAANGQHAENGHRILLPARAADLASMEAPTPTPPREHVETTAPAVWAPSRTPYGEAFAESPKTLVDRDYLHLLLLINGRRTPTELARLLWSHQADAEQKVLRLLAELRRFEMII